MRKTLLFDYVEFSEPAATQAARAMASVIQLMPLPYISR
jgi:hypothetical protein